MYQDASKHDVQMATFGPFGPFGIGSNCWSSHPSQPLQRFEQTLVGIFDGGKGCHHTGDVMSVPGCRHLSTMRVKSWCIWQLDCAPDFVSCMAKPQKMTKSLQNGTWSGHFEKLLSRFKWRLPCFGSYPNHQRPETRSAPGHSDVYNSTHALFYNCVRVILAK